MVSYQPSRGLGRGAWRDKPEEAERARSEVARLGWNYAMRFCESRNGRGILDLLAALDDKDLEFLRSSRFLLAEETARLLMADEALLLTMPKARRVQFDAMQEARGRIDWPATIKERLSRGSDPTWLAVQQADWHAASPERRALAWILDEIAAAWKGTGRHAAFADIASKARRLRQGTLLVDVKNQQYVTQRDRQALRQSRSKVFREEVNDAIAFRDKIQSNDIEVLREVLGERIWLPPEDDKLFEIWVLFSLVETLIEHGWVVVRMALMRPGAAGKVAFELDRGEVKAELRFQTLSSDVETGSRYGPLIRSYGLGDGDRRPDICVSVSGPQGTQHILIEAKLTEDRDYLVESVYKVFGYLHDYELGLQNSRFPQAALVVWGGIQPSLVDPADRLRIFDSSSVRLGEVAALISAASLNVKAV